MKKRFSILPFLVAVAVLFAILFQSVHSVEHISKELAEAKCHHDRGSNKSDITHQHHEFDHCFSCEFTFSGSTITQTFTFSYFQSLPIFKHDGLLTTRVVSGFSGSLFSLRGPPIAIC